MWSSYLRFTFQNKNSIPYISPHPRWRLAVCSICTRLCAEALVPKHSMGQECGQASRAGTDTAPAPHSMWNHISLKMPLTKSNSLRALRSTFSKPHLSKPGLWLHVSVWEQAREREGRVRKTNHGFEFSRRKRGIRFHRAMTQAWLGKYRQKCLDSK